jgi:hypothetical protein
MPHIFGYDESNPPAGEWKLGVRTGGSFIKKQILISFNDSYSNCHHAFRAVHCAGIGQPLCVLNSLH